MWPWEHLAVGYLLVSLWRRARGGQPPSDREALVVLFATQLPDLVDKPLGWSTSLLPGGLSLAHSLLVAVPVAVAVALLARAGGVPEVGSAFGLAYLSHLPADALYPVVLGDGPKLNFLLWPLVPAVRTDPEPFAAHLFEIVAAFREFLASPRAVVFVGFEVALLAVALLQWYRDGLPGLATARGLVRRIVPARSL